VKERNIERWGERENTNISANTDRKNIPQLVAKVDPGNIASAKIVERIGGRKGEVLKEVS
jgi:predicted acetyltransferase